MNKEEENLLIKKVKESIQNLCNGYEHIIDQVELKIRSEEVLRDTLYKYIGKENIIHLNIYTDDNGIIHTDIKLIENEYTKHWIDFFERHKKGDNVDE